MTNWTGLCFYLLPWLIVLPSLRLIVWARRKWLAYRWAQWSKEERAGYVLLWQVNNAEARVATHQGQCVVRLQRHNEVRNDDGAAHD